MRASKVNLKRSLNLISAVIGIYFCMISDAWPDIWLVTPDEAKKTESQAVDWKAPAAFTVGAGPNIIIHYPGALEKVKVPLDIFLSFEPGKSGKPPDMNSLSVTLIGFFTIDITHRIREYIAGTTLKVEEAKLPEGNHRLRIAIKDSLGNKNERDMIVNVVAK